MATDRDRTKKNNLFGFFFCVMTFGLVLVSLGYAYDRVATLVLLLAIVLHGLLFGFLSRLYPQFISKNSRIKHLSIIFLFAVVSIIGISIVSRGNFILVIPIAGYLFAAIHFLTESWRNERLSG